MKDQKIEEFLATIRRSLSELETFEEAAIRKVLEQCYNAGFCESVQILEKHKIENLGD